MVKSATLTVTHPGGKQHAHMISEKVFSIGRNEENDLSLDNPYISRFHAEIMLDGPAFWIHDLGSTSGTFINGERVKHRELADGDQIRLGRAHGIEMTFETAERTDELSKPNEDSMSRLQPVRVITPEDTRFIDTSRLPESGDLADKTVDRLRALYEFTSEILTAHSAPELSEKIAAFLHRSLKPERCAVLIDDKERRTLEISASFPAGIEIAPSSSITRRVFSENVSVLSMDASSDKRFASGESVRFQSIRSVMCAPMGSKSRLWGVCYVDNLKDDKSFDEEELDFLTAVARQAGLAMENLYLMEEQRRSLESFIRTLAASLDARDDSTAGHSARVGAYSAAIARAMNLSQPDCRIVYYAGLLHDYGKIGIRDDVLLKPAQLTPDEYEHIKEHPLHTFRLLSKIRLPEDLADIPFVAAAHHERWDGTGYPHGLKGEEIPLGSRIVAVADAYDALTEERVYNKPCSPEKALKELKLRSGSYFDPSVIEAFAEYFQSEIKPRHRRRRPETVISTDTIQTEAVQSGE